MRLWSQEEADTDPWREKQEAGDGWTGGTGPMHPGEEGGLWRQTARVRIPAGPLTSLRILAGVLIHFPHL